MKVMGDLQVKRTMTAEVRADRGLRSATITAAETLNKNSYSWQKLTAAAPQDVIMPDATTIINGWQVTIQAITSDLTVKDGDTGATIKVVPAGETYQFTCTDNSSTAGEWHSYTLEDFGAIAATRYASDFNATTDWGTAAGGVYTLTVTGATHLRGVNPSVLVYETAGAVETRVDLDISYNSSTGDVSFVVPEEPNCRFAGRAVFI